MHLNLLKNVLISECEAPIAAGSSTDENTDILDMINYDGIVFIVPITDSADTGVAALTIEGSAANSDTAMAAITGAVATATSATNDDLNGLLLIVDVYRPLLRYIQGVLTSATANIAFGNTLAIRYNGRKSPVSDDATIAQAISVVGS